MPRQVLILHGWSDKSESFKPLAKFLKREGFDAIPLFLGDYISLRDDVKIDDVAKQMEEVIRGRMSKPAGHRQKLAKRFDMIVHSTGGLVARRWIANHYGDGRQCPVRNLLMLAPANFGSKLAHKGRSLLGRIYKGWRTGFETGEEMLLALELGSPFQWQLAQQDLFVPADSTPSSVPRLYGADKVRPFVIVGSHPYPELTAKLTNENGSDGTVRVAAANMNAYGRTVDFSGPAANLLRPTVTSWRKRGGDNNRFPFAVLPDRTHGSIIDPSDPGLSKLANVRDQLGKLILQALRVNNETQYHTVHSAWVDVCGQTRQLAGDGDAAQEARDALFKKRGTPREFFHEYYQLMVRVVDEFGEPVPDYFVTFMPKTRKHWYSLRATFSKLGVFFHDEVLEDTHKHETNPANRCFFFDRFDIMRQGGFYSQIATGKPKELHFTISAADPGDRIAYFSHAKSMNRGLVHIHEEADRTKRWLKRHCTHFLKIIIPRAATPDVFKIKRG